MALNKAIDSIREGNRQRFVSDDPEQSTKELNEYLDRNMKASIAGGARVQKRVMENFAKIQESLATGQLQTADNARAMGRLSVMMDTLQERQQQEESKPKQGIMNKAVEASRNKTADAIKQNLPDQDSIISALTSANPLVGYGVKMMRDMSRAALETRKEKKKNAEEELKRINEVSESKITQSEKQTEIVKETNESNESNTENNTNNFSSEESRFVSFEKVDERLTQTNTNLAEIINQQKNLQYIGHRLVQNTNPEKIEIERVRENMRERERVRKSRETQSRTNNAKEVGTFWKSFSEGMKSSMDKIAAIKKRQPDPEKRESEYLAGRFDDIIKSDINASNDSDSETTTATSLSNVYEKDQQQTNSENTVDISDIRKSNNTAQGINVRSISDIAETRRDTNNNSNVTSLSDYRNRQSNNDETTVTRLSSRDMATNERNINRENESANDSNTRNETNETNRETSNVRNRMDESRVEVTSIEKSIVSVDSRISNIEEFALESTGYLESIDKSVSRDNEKSKDSFNSENLTSTNENSVQLLTRMDENTSSTHEYTKESATYLSNIEKMLSDFMRDRMSDEQRSRFAAIENRREAGKGRAGKGRGKNGAKGKFGEGVLGTMANIAEILRLGAFSAIGATLATAASAAIGKIKGAFNRIGNMAKPIMKLAGRASPWGAAIMGLYDFGKGFINAADVIGDDAKDGVSWDERIRAGASGLLGSLFKLGDNLLEFVGIDLFDSENIEKTIYNIGDNVRDYIVGGVKGLYENIKDYITGFFNLDGINIETIKTSVTSGITTVTDSITDTIGRAWSSISSTIKSFSLDNIKDKVLGIFGIGGDDDEEKKEQPSNTSTSENVNTQQNINSVENRQSAMTQAAIDNQRDNPTPDNVTREVERDGDTTRTTVTSSDRNTDYARQQWEKETGGTVIRDSDGNVLSREEVERLKNSEGAQELNQMMQSGSTDSVMSSAIKEKEKQKEKETNKPDNNITISSDKELFGRPVVRDGDGNVLSEKEVERLKKSEGVQQLKQSMQSNSTDSVMSSAIKEKEKETNKSDNNVTISSDKELFGKTVYRDFEGNELSEKEVERLSEKSRQMMKQSFEKVASSTKETTRVSDGNSTSTMADIQSNRELIDSRVKENNVENSSNMQKTTITRVEGGSKEKEEKFEKENENSEMVDKSITKGEKITEKGSGDQTVILTKKGIGDIISGGKSDSVTEKVTNNQDNKPQDKKDNVPTIEITNPRGEAANQSDYNTTINRSDTFMSEKNNNKSISESMSENVNQSNIPRGNISGQMPSRQTGQAIRQEAQAQQQTNNNNTVINAPVTNNNNNSSVTHAGGEQTTKNPEPFSRQLWSRDKLAGRGY